MSVSGSRMVGVVFVFLSLSRLLLLHWYSLPLHVTDSEILKIASVESNCASLNGFIACWLPTIAGSVFCNW